jgi:molybdopterin-synthase adenylyltransferase
MRATLVGAGGLGGPIALSLGAAGIELLIADPGKVELSSLPRMIHLLPTDVGGSKASLLAGAVVARGGRARAESTHWTPQTAEALGADADVVIDTSGDPATSLAVTEWAVANGRCHLIVSAQQFGGGVFVGAPGHACFRCLLEEPGNAGPSTGAVLGPVTGAIGGVAAALAIGLARGERSYAGALFAFDDLRRSTEPTIDRFEPRSGCGACARSPIPPLRSSVRVARGNHA